VGARDGQNRANGNAVPDGNWINENSRKREVR
jgi:hypothetical protein